jgi:hypothetical protein
MNSPIQDLVDMIKQFKEADVEKLLETAYSRGFQDGVRITKVQIIEKVKGI